MATIKGTYKGNLRNEMTHLQSGNTILTDAPTDNHGKGEAFSPTKAKPSRPPTSPAQPSPAA